MWHFEPVSSGTPLIIAGMDPTAHASSELFWHGDKAEYVLPVRSVISRPIVTTLLVVNLYMHRIKVYKPSWLIR